MKKVPRFKDSITVGELAQAGRSILGGQDDGKLTAEFEKAFASYIGGGSSVFINSARLGLYYIFKYLDLPKGSEVLIPSVTYPPIPAMCLPMDLVPRFVDVDPFTFTIDVKDLERKITPKSKVIIPTHLYGQICDMDEVMALASKHGLFVIEDCAQSLGGEYKGRKTGAIGNASYFTFGITKNFTTLEGASVYSRDKALIDFIRCEQKAVPYTKKFDILKLLIKALIMKTATNSVIFPLFVYPVVRAFKGFGIDLIDRMFGETFTFRKGISRSYFSKRPGGIQAEMGLSQLQRIDGLNDDRIRNARAISSFLKKGGSIGFPEIKKDRKSIYMSFPLNYPDTGKLAAFLFANGVDVTRGFMFNCNDMEEFRDYKAECPNAAGAIKGLLHIPVFPSLSKAEIEMIGAALKKFYGTEEK